MTLYIWAEVLKALEGTGDSVLKKSRFALTAQNPIGFKRFYVGTGCDVFKAARAAIRLRSGLLRLKDKGYLC